jgi:hypothetical protein
MTTLVVNAHHDFRLDNADGTTAIDIVVFG